MGASLPVSQLSNTGVIIGLTSSASWVYVLFEDIEEAKCIPKSLPVPQLSSYDIGVIIGLS